MGYSLNDCIGADALQMHHSFGQLACIQEWNLGPELLPYGLLAVIYSRVTSQIPHKALLLAVIASCCHQKDSCYYAN